MEPTVVARQISASTYQIICPKCGGTTNFRASTIGGTTRCRNCGLAIFVSVHIPKGLGCFQSCLITVVALPLFVVLLVWLNGSAPSDRLPVNSHVTRSPAQTREPELEDALIVQDPESDTVSEPPTGGHVTRFELRTWNSASDEYVAGFYSRAADNVTLELENGEKVTVNLRDLSVEDMEYVEKRKFVNE